MTTRLTPLPPESFRSKPWKNGGGVTHDIADASQIMLLDLKLLHMNCKNYF